MAQAYWGKGMYAKVVTEFNEYAFKSLEAAYQARDIGLMRLNTDFLLDPLRSDARFAEMAGKVGLRQWK